MCVCAPVCVCVGACVRARAETANHLLFVCVFVLFPVHEAYGLGTAAVTVITLCSLVGAVLVRLGRGVGRHYAMAAMLGLAVGNLCGDAILHLLPEVRPLRYAQPYFLFSSTDGSWGLGLSLIHI